jgi:molybdopterin converting factor small subunit
VLVTVRFFAGARAAAGTAETKVDAATVEELVAVLTARHGEALARVLAVASFLVDETVCHDHRAALPPGASVDVLPPFAGG